MSSRHDQIAELRAAIAAQENMRSTLGDATVELSLKPLRSLLESLLAQEALPSPSASSPEDQALLADSRATSRNNSPKSFGRAAIQGERRQVTVVFADLSGIHRAGRTPRSRRGHSFLNDCMKELIDAVYQYEGMVNQIIGDCVMAVFGAPIALEDDAERALRAALAMRERLSHLTNDGSTNLRSPWRFIRG